jgi:phospholipase C
MANERFLPFCTRPSISLKTGRRQFLKRSALAGAGLALAGSQANAVLAAAKNAKKPLPQPNKSGIEHIVLVMMENRSFDHFLGWLPGADGKQAGLTYLDETGTAFPTYPLAPDYQGCDHPGPAHDYEAGRVEYNNGACDGWLRAGDNDRYAIGYYTQDDLAFLSGAAPEWTTCDRYFSAIMSSTYPNRVYQHAAQTDRLDNTPTISTLPTIWDRLAEHSVSRKYYFSDLPLVALWGAKYLPITHRISEFFDDCAAGTLPRFSMVDPHFIGEEIGITNDDHPHADIRNGEAFLNDIYNAIVSSPNWETTMLVINYDEWGGFFDHVPPTTASIPPADAALGSDGLRGFRVPALVISPFARRGYVAHGLYDHTSVLRMIEWRWNLRPLTVRDANANNLAEVLDFSQRDLSAPQFPVPPGPFGAPCPLIGAIPDEWTALAEQALALGFEVLL